MQEHAFLLHFLAILGLKLSISLVFLDVLIDTWRSLFQCRIYQV